MRAHRSRKRRGLRSGSACHWLYSLPISRRTNVRNIPFKKRFSDIDPNDMIELARIIDSDLRPVLYKRVAESPCSERHFP
jgi:hypothetical protein